MSTTFEWCRTLQGLWCGSVVVQIKHLLRHCMWCLRPVTLAQVLIVQSSFKHMASPMWLSTRLESKEEKIVLQTHTRCKPAQHCHRAGERESTRMCLAQLSAPGCFWRHRLCSDPVLENFHYILLIFSCHCHIDLFPFDCRWLMVPISCDCHCIVCSWRVLAMFTLELGRRDCTNRSFKFQSMHNFNWIHAPSDKCWQLNCGFRYPCNLDRWLELQVVNEMNSNSTVYYPLCWLICSSTLSSWKPNQTVKKTSLSPLQKIVTSSPSQNKILQRLVSFSSRWSCDELCRKTFFRFLLT